ncbi:MAG TPA: CHRD domain-containing protein [Solirubrobacteraceae bacterium]
MRQKLLVCAGAALALGTAGCGSSSSSSHAPGRPSAGTGTILIYRATLAGVTGRPSGAPAGTGDAVVALHGSTVLCWRFAHLHGFVNATAAQIQLGSKGQPAHPISALSTGPRLHHRGCLTIGSATAKAIEHRPGDYYVAIDSTRYPGGAVRGRL